MRRWRSYPTYGDARVGRIRRLRRIRNGVQMQHALSVLDFTR